MKNAPYQGYEVGAIRPPSEADSLMLRVTRNCNWNRCKFCGLYKGHKFSIRPPEHVIKDIDSIRTNVDLIMTSISKQGAGAVQELAGRMSKKPEAEYMAFMTAYHWFRYGMKSVFLQDGNSIVLKPDNLITILHHLKKQFPQIGRITTYARSKNLSKVSDDDLARIAEAGLNRIHNGMESGADSVLEFMNKGVTKKEHIIAGQKAKRAGIELSVYFMPGLGGIDLTRDNALETADALNQTNPDFIRIRTLAIPEDVELRQNQLAGTFKLLNDKQVANELLLFLNNLDGIHSTLKSDHILNLLQEVEGTLPDDKEKMIAPLERFLSLGEGEQTLFMVGRRTGIYNNLNDIDDPVLRLHAEKMIEDHKITPENVDDFTASMMTRFI